jgi:hypothetical protein
VPNHQQIASPRVLSSQPIQAIPQFPQQTVIVQPPTQITHQPTQFQKSNSQLLQLNSQYGLNPAQLIQPSPQNIQPQLNQNYQSNIKNVASIH